MAWEKGRYYTRSRKVKGRVIREYIGGGEIGALAAHLAKRLQDAGHTLAAAHWAVHNGVRAGRLRAGLIEVELPSFGRVVGGTMRHCGEPDDRRMVWSGGQKGTVGIPKGKPAPFDNFKVTATDSLWAWWRSLTIRDAQQSEPGAIPIREGDAYLGVIEDDILTNAAVEQKHTRWEDSEDAELWRDLKRLHAELTKELDDRETSVPDELIEPGPLRGTPLYEAVRAVERHYPGSKLPVQPWCEWRGMLLRADEGQGEEEPHGRYEQYFKCSASLCQWAETEMARLQAALNSEPSATVDLPTEAGNDKPDTSTEPANVHSKAKQPKRSTERGEARVKLDEPDDE